MERDGRVDAGPLIAIPGAVLLLVSLFVDWYELGANAWEVFEVWDVVLAASALACLLAAADRLGLAIPGGRALSRWFIALGVLSLVIVLSQAINHPPAALEADADTGLWLGLGGAALLALGAVLSTARISLEVEGRGAARPGATSPASPDPVPPPPPAGGAAAGREETAPLNPPAPREGPR